jgi:hypothetical protein
MMQSRMRQMALFAAVAVGLVVVFAGTAFAQTNIGTWKLNIAKSKYNAGTAPKSVTVTIAAAGAGMKGTMDAVGADGTVSHSTATANYDGKDNPITGNNPNADTLAFTRVDANTTRTVYKKGGKVTTTATGVVSSDGNTMTITTTGTNPQGQKVDSVTVYDKQ